MADRPRAAADRAERDFFIPSTASMYLLAFERQTLVGLVRHRGPRHGRSVTWLGGGEEPRPVRCIMHEVSEFLLSTFFLSLFIVLLVFLSFDPSHLPSSDLRANNTTRGYFSTKL